jgi:hypothetical protein
LNPSFCVAAIDRRGDVVLLREKVGKDFSLLVQHGSEFLKVELSSEGTLQSGGCNEMR